MSERDQTKTVSATSQAAYMADLLSSLHYLSWPSPLVLIGALLAPQLNWPLTNWLWWMAMLAVLLMQLFLAWQIYFDARLFRSLANHNDDGSELDAFLLQLFHKPIRNASLAERIAGSQKLIRRYLIWTVLMWLSLWLVDLLIMP